MLSVFSLWVCNVDSEFTKSDAMRGVLRHLFCLRWYFICLLVKMVNVAKYCSVLFGLTGKSWEFSTGITGVVCTLVGIML